MPEYISAYDLQQQRGLSRRQVLELAENGPAFWRVHEAHISTIEFYKRNPGIKRVVHTDPLALVEAECPIDLSALTKDHLYWLDGFNKLKDQVLKDWQLLIAKFRQSIKPGDNPHEYIIPDPDQLCRELRLDDWLGECLPDYLTGQEAAKLFGKYCPSVIRDNPDGKLSKHTIIESVTAEGKDDSLLSAFHIYKLMDADQLWIEIAYSQDIIFDLYFQPIFKEWLYFTDNEEQVTSIMQPEPTESLPPFEITSRAPQGRGKAQVKSILADNQVAQQYISLWRSKKQDDADIARELKSKGSSWPIIGCLLYPNKDSKEAATDQVKRLIGQKK